MNDWALLKEIVYDLRYKYNKDIHAYLEHLKDERKKLEELNESHQVTFEPFPTKYIDRKIELIEMHLKLKEGLQCE